jgi:hypothetical protein
VKLTNTETSGGAAMNLGREWSGFDIAQNAGLAAVVSTSTRFPVRSSPGQHLLALIVHNPSFILVTHFITRLLALILSTEAPMVKFHEHGR